MHFLPKASSLSKQAMSAVPSHALTYGSKQRQAKLSKQPNRNVCDEDSDNLEEPLDCSGDYGQKPQSIMKEEALLSPKFGKEFSGEDISLRDQTTQKQGGSSIKNLGVLGNLLSGGTKVQKKRTKTLT